MAKELSISLRRCAAVGFILLLVSFLLSVVAAAQQVQVPAPPYVVSSAGTSPAHTFDSGPNIKGCAVAPTGDAVCLDLNNNHLWHFPVDGRPVQDIGFVTSDHSWKNNFGVGIDSKLNLWVGGNYAINGIYRIPYNTATKTWSVSQEAPFATSGIPTDGWWFQPTAIAVDKNDSLVVATLNGPSGNTNAIFTVVVNADYTAGTSGYVVKSMKNRADWVAVDHAGNIFFAEEGFGGVYMLPAGQTIAGDGTGSMEVGPDGLPRAPLVRLDMLASDSPAVPDAANPAKFRLNNNISGLALDGAGNLYYGDSSDQFNDANLKGGIWMVPNEDGTLNPAHTVFISPIPTTGGLAIDNRTGVLWAAVYGTWNGIVDVGKFTFGRAFLGEAAVGGQGSTVTIFNAFNNDDSIADDPNLQEVFNVLPGPSGAADFKQVGGTCGGQPIYHQNDRCTVTFAITPSVVGRIHGAVALQQKLKTGVDAENHDIFLTPYPTVATTTLEGVGTGAEVALFASPVESVMGTAITGANQVTTDNAGNVFVAAAGMQSVLAYPPNSNAATTPVHIGKNLSAPTGVAVDGLGNVFIADTGQIIHVPYQYVSGQWMWNGDAQVVIKTGLGGSLKLAANTAGYLFVADPDNQRVLKIRIYYPPAQVSSRTPATGIGLIAQTEESIPFATLTGIGVDAAGNLLVADGTNAIRVDERGVETVIAANIGAANALAMDPSSGLYYSTATGAFRVPVVGDVLSVDQKLALGTGVTAAAGIALDRRQNVYLADTTALNVRVVTVHGTANFGAIALGDRPTLESQVFNVGNSPLTFAVNANGQFPNTTDVWNGITIANFTAVGAAANGCDGVTPTPLAAGGSCFIATTFNPAAGQEGPLTGQITLASDAVNVPVILNVAGVAGALTQTTTAIAVASGSTANSAPVTVTVTPQTGTGIPTGEVTILIDGVVKASGTLGADGKASFDLKPVKAGSHAYKAAYGGDRVYGRSTASSTVAIAKGVTSISQPALTLNPADPRAAYLPYVLAQIQNADDYVYKYRVSVIAGPAGDAMIPTPKDCVTTAADICGKTVLLDSANVAQQRVDLGINTGIAEFPSSGFKNDPDSKALHPVTEYTVTPVYLGDDNYQQSTGTPVTFKLVRTPSVLITKDGGEGPIAVSAGSSATASLSAKSMFGFGLIAPYDGQVEFQCDNLPPYAACSFSPARVAVVGKDATHPVEIVGHTVLTVTTNVPVGAVASNHAPAGWLFATSLGFGLVGLVFGRKSRFKGRVLTVICTALIIGGALAGMTACGTSTGANSNPAAKTPTGTYTVVVTAREIGGTQGNNAYQQNWVSIPYSVTVNVQ